MRLTSERDEYRRLYDHRGKVLQHPCLKCGYVPRIIKLAVGEGDAEINYR